MILFLSLLIVLFLPISGFTDEITYQTHIQPIFEKRCTVCHGAKVSQGGLRLDRKANALAGGISELPSIVPGSPEKSHLFQLITNKPPQKVMPVSGERLSDEQIEVIRQWIAEGAKWEESGEENAGVDNAGSEHWAFIEPKRPEVPDVSQPDWVRNPIDSFVLAKLDEKKIAPSPEADKYTLLRRVHLDLTGIPPTPQEIETFVNDKSPNAYGKVVDRLLASPHYGERWGRHWLDLARYADSNGYSIDAPRSIWKYRDWVIDAFNEDLSFDRFTIYQLAGDLLPHSDMDAKVATGFHRNTQINEEGGIDVEQFRIESVVDRVNTTGAVFLGLTVACAQCHDHKFDPIAQKEYYQLFSFFNQDDEPEMEVPTPEEAAQLAGFNSQFKLLRDELADYEKDLRKTFDHWRQELTKGDIEALSKEVKAIPAALEMDLTDDQVNALWEHYKKNDPGYEQRSKTVQTVRRQKPDVPTTMVLEARKEPRETYIHIQGDFTRKGAVVSSGVPNVLHALYEPKREQHDLTRLDLALWLVSPENPLTARVTMNRFWQRYFGKGLVETENDFGTRGAPPTHPELLDWLATEFIRQGWSMKTMHRLIVTSSTYRQSSHLRPQLSEIDPYNYLLARQNRLRLDAEIIRDTSLAASGLLSEKIGGPSVYPPQPDGVTKLGQVQRGWKTSDGEDRYRRGLYTFLWRATPHSMLVNFDASSGNVTCTRRNRSNIPLQSLNLLNDEAFFETAVALAERTLLIPELSDGERVQQAFELAMVRKPDAGETAILLDLLKDQREDFSDAEDDAKKIAKFKQSKELDNRELAAWTMVTRTILNTDEFITRE